MHVIGFFKPTLFIRDAGYSSCELQASRTAPDAVWMLEAAKPEGGDPPAGWCRL